MSASFLCQVGQCLGVDGFIEECEAGGAKQAVALSILFSHEHVVQAWGEVRGVIQVIRPSRLKQHLYQRYINMCVCCFHRDLYREL